MTQVANTVITEPAYISNDTPSVNITVTDPISGAKTVTFATGYYEFQFNDGTGDGTEATPWHILKKLADATTTNWTYEMGTDGRLIIGYLGTGTATFVFADSHVKNLFGSTSSTLTFTGAGTQTMTYPVFGMFISKSRKGDGQWKHTPGFSIYQETTDSRVIGWNDGNHKQTRKFSFDFLPRDQNFKDAGMVSTPAYPVSASTWNTTPTALSYTAPYTALRFLKSTQGKLLKLYLGPLPYNGTDDYFKVYFRPDSIKKANRFTPSINGNEKYVTMDEVEVLLSDADSGEATYSAGTVPVYLPMTISGLQAWWLADDVTLSGGKITQFNDRSGNARHATNANVTYQVTQSVDAAYNSKNVAVMNGSANQAYAPTSFTIAQPFTIIAVGDVNGTAGVDYETFIDSANVGTRVIMRSDPSFNMIVYAGWANITLRTYDVKANAAIAWCEYNGASSKGNVNSTTATALSSPGASPLTQPQLFVGNSAGYPLKNGGKFAALLIYNRVLTTDEKTSLLGYLSTYYGITLT
jgi:hypothetical protein